MKKDWELTPESFGRLLDWLDSDRQKAGEKYQKIRLRLIKIFASHGCSNPEDLADRTFNTVTSKIDWLVENYIGDPILYFCGVARNIIKEDLRERTRTTEFSESKMRQDDNDEEQVYDCLDRCLATLSEKNLRLVREYYQEKGHEKITHRRRMADELDITMRALRLRVYHLRLQLRECIEKCLEQGSFR